MYWNLPTMTYKAAESNLQILKNQKRVFDAINQIPINRRSDINITELQQSLNLNRRDIQDAIKEYNLIKDKMTDALKEKEDNAKNAKSNAQKARKEANRLQKQIDQCPEEVRSLIKDLREQLHITTEKLKNEIDNNARLSTTINDYKCIGLSRFTLSTDEFHETNPHACHQLFGFNSWSELKQYHLDFFDWGEDDIMVCIVSSTTPITLFEKSLMWLMRVRVNMKQSQLIIIFGRSKTCISEYLQTVGPLWMEIGYSLCQLDINESFLTLQMPQEFTDAKMTNVAALSDGKDFKSETVRVDSFYSRAGYSSKVSCNAFRIITYSLPYGLVFLVSPLLFARATEGSIVSLLGRSDVVELV